MKKEKGIDDNSGNQIKERTPESASQIKERKAPVEKTPKEVKFDIKPIIEIEVPQFDEIR